MICSIMTAASWPPASAEGAEAATAVSRPSRRDLRAARSEARRPATVISRARGCRISRPEA